MKTGLFFILLSMSCSVTLAGADPFDEKASAAAQEQQQVAAARAHQKALSFLNQNNATMIRRVPRNASSVTCFDTMAARYRLRSNGCRLGDSQWNGIPVQICYETVDRGLPPEIVECHYRLPNGRDCEIWRNASIPPRCL